MLPDRERQALKKKIKEYFNNDDGRLTDAALRLQDDGYGDTDIINILNAAYNAGRDQGWQEGYDDAVDLLTDDELDELHSLLENELLYGDDELVYMTSENGRLQNERLSSVLRKVEDEAKRRGRWWAR